MLHRISDEQGFQCLAENWNCEEKNKKQTKLHNFEPPESQRIGLVINGNRRLPLTYFITSHPVTRIPLLFICIFVYACVCISVNVYLPVCVCLSASVCECVYASVHSLV